MLLPRWPFYLSVALVTGVMLAAYQNFSGHESLTNCQPLHPEIGSEYQVRHLGIQPRGNISTSTGISKSDEGHSGVVSLELDWSEIEDQGFQNDLSRAVVFSEVASQSKSFVHLLVRPFRGSDSKFPSDLKKKNFALDHPEVIRRYSEAVVKILNQINFNRNRVVGVMIGEDVGDYLGESLPNWEAYQKFAFWVRNYIRKDFPGLPISIGSTYEKWNNFENLTLARKFREVQCTVDVVGINYLPSLGSKKIQPANVRANLDQVLSDYPKHLVHIYRSGYPVSPIVGGSPESQTQFVREILSFWNQNKTRVPYLSINQGREKISEAFVNPICENQIRRSDLAPETLAAGYLPVGIEFLNQGSSLEVRLPREFKNSDTGESKIFEYDPLKYDLQVSDRLALFGSNLGHADVAYQLDRDIGLYVRSDLVFEHRQRRAPESFRLMAQDSLKGFFEANCQDTGEFCNMYPPNQIESAR